MSPSPTRVAPHDGQVASWSEGSTAEHHMQRGAGVDPPVVASSSMAPLYRVEIRREPPDRASRGDPTAAWRLACYSHSIVAGGFDEMS